MYTSVSGFPGAMATAKELTLLLTCCRWCRSLRGPQSRVSASFLCWQNLSKEDDLGDASRSKHLRPFCFSRGLQAFAALVPGVSQVDNNSDFLGKKPHRKHPGILRLPHVRLPQALTNAAQLLLLGEKLRGGETKETKRGRHAVMRLSVCGHRETRPHYREAGAGALQLSLEPTFAGRGGGVAKTSCGP